MDISLVKQFLGPTLQMATVFDAFSRVPLALQVFDQTPDGPDMARLLRAAARAFGRPKYLITDKGGQFVAGAFRKAARRLGAQHRFAVTDSILATASTASTSPSPARTSSAGSSSLSSTTTTVALPLGAAAEARARAQ